MTKTIIRLLGSHGGELDREVIPGRDPDSEAIQYATVQIALRCTLTAGDTITITEED